MKRILIALICGISVQGVAQILDLLGTSAVDGVMMKGNVSSVASGMSALKRTQTVQTLSHAVNMIRIDAQGDYRNIQKYKMHLEPFKKMGYAYELSTHTAHEFDIILKNVDDYTCRMFVTSGVGAKYIDVNGEGKEKSACSEKSKIKFTFE